jgi:uncharacterized protein YwqG
MLKHEVSELFKEHEALIKPTIRKCNEITFRVEKAKPWESKLGGCPYLEDISDYPVDTEGRPMMFLAQINCSELMELDNMPLSGLLQFFIRDDELYGLNAPCVVRYIEQYITDEKKLVSENPYEKSYKGWLPFSKAGRMYYEAGEMPLPASCEDSFSKVFDGITFNEAQEDKLFDEFDSAGSRVGGYPYFLQSEPPFFETCNHVLLQLDLDDECGIMFGDAGNCNFFITEEDLKKKDFSNVEYEWQCA